jgi:hypothetical protein
MEATAALAPVLGVDAASLVGRALHARRVLGENQFVGRTFGEIDPFETCQSRPAVRV